MYRRWWRENSECASEDDGSNRMEASSVDFDKVQGLYYLLISGVLIGFLLSFLELIYRCIVDAKRKKCTFGQVCKELLARRGRMSKCSSKDSQMDTAPQGEDHSYPSVQNNLTCPMEDMLEPQIFLPAISSIQSPTGCPILYKTEVSGNPMEYAL
ncbi:hypothetical protein Ciccas_009297 [Cichlidogyrus casuarinus]|uniref:Uncharacterized protein n=1 Tax=Cichlidogyrus casuarinus TaxID=1844966 RepID=A0ABD2PY42_9PLAT